MKILLLGEYSNVHATLAEGLRALGHKVTVASNGDFWKDYPRDIDLSRKSQSSFHGMLLYIKIKLSLIRFRNYDVVQLINPMFFELKAERLFSIYYYLHRHNKKIFLCGFGMDWYWINGCRNTKPLRYSDFNIGDKLRDTPDTKKEIEDWCSTYKEMLNKYIANSCNGIITGLYEYYVCYHPIFNYKTTFIPFPLKIEESNVNNNNNNDGKVRFFIGINKSRSAYKGTDIMLEALEKLKKKYPERCEIIRAENVPFNEYKKMMDSCDCILDQLYSYTPAMNALLAMSKGIIDIGGGEEENYMILNENELRPIINVLPDINDVYDKLEQVVLHPERLPELKRQSIEYVRKHHDYIKVAKQYLNFYTNGVEKKV